MIDNICQCLIWQYWTISECYLQYHNSNWSWNSHLNKIVQYWTIFDNIGQFSTILGNIRYIGWTISQYSSIYIVSNNITSHLVIRQDHAAFLIFFPLTFTFPSSSPITSICSLKTGTRGTTGQYWLYWTLVGNAWQV